MIKESTVEALFKVTLGIVNLNNKLRQIWNGGNLTLKLLAWDYWNWCYMGENGNSFECCVCRGLSHTMYWVSLMLADQAAFETKGLSRVRQRLIWAPRRCYICQCVTSQFEVSSHERNKSICNASGLSMVNITFYLLCVSASIEVSSPQRIKYEH